MKVIDISLPIYNKMWSYRKEWENKLETVESTATGGKSTVYNFNFYSHTGTYIETSQHKLKNNILLSDYPLSSFYSDCLLVVVDACKDGEITMEKVRKSIRQMPGNYLLSCFPLPVEGVSASLCRAVLTEGHGR